MAADQDDSNPRRWTERRASRRSILRYTVLSAAALSVAAACQQAATPAPTTAPAPAAPKPTTAPAAAATTAPAAGAAQPTTPAQTAPAAVPKVSINGKFTVVQARDFHPDHNTLVENKIKEFAGQQGWALDHSYIEAFAGAGDVVQKLTATVQAGEPPDLLIHGEAASQFRFLDIIEEVDAVEMEIEKDHGKALPGYTKAQRLEDKWWAVPFYGRAGGLWVRQSVYKDAGIDPFTELDTFEKLRDTALRISKPEQELWGWGRTANRGGDGAGLVNDVIFMSGGQYADETGQLVVFNKDPYRQGAIAGLTYLKEIFMDPKYASMLPPGIGGWTDPTNNEAFLGGKIAMTSNAGTVFAKAVFDKNPVADDTYLLPNPKGIGPMARQLWGAGDCYNLFIMKGAKNRQASEVMIKFLTSQAMHKEMFKISTGYVYPAREWGWDEPEIKESKYAQQVTPTWQKVLNDPSGYIGISYPGPPQPHITSLGPSNFATDLFGEILAGKSVEQAVADGHNRLVRTFKEFGAKGE
jgi:ABC-type glycerol-3-phosphate transport system substrate-binding protein